MEVFNFWADEQEDESEIEVILVWKLFICPKNCSGQKKRGENDFVA